MSSLVHQGGSVKHEAEAVHGTGVGIGAVRGVGMDTGAMRGMEAARGMMIVSEVPATEEG
jgi:hypothetical protein